ncbi:2-oxo acid dehydrogenase subunit E2 [Sphaerisporangium album]|uniref:Dihydrolipoamide acetyltransferase component of pyruvate dehydrogenase complex n=1 Tax=Sphaerisporangium album TaxID=509200 RepID=A0A367FRU3_9ACTN|nr:dihydrolipoamide acetyltransferase family protein [Sphaerisporangium album]RCG32944.1 2-oxo acid dehydrogenase subunit E2 [Sphaerisporangium album]
MSERTFLLPDLGEGLTEAEIVRWLVAEGDEVAIDQAVVEVETAKSIVEVPSPFAGTVSRLHGAEGETREVGKPLISVTAQAGPRAGSAAAESTALPAAETYREEEKAGSGNVLIGYGTPAPGSSARRRRPRASAPASRSGAPAPAAPPVAAASAPAHLAPLVLSPLVRQLARSNGIDLREVRGTGGGGLITRGDVQGAVRHGEGAVGHMPVAAVTTPSAGPAPASERRTPLNGFRKAVSASLSRSRSEIPEATVWVDVDATALVELRERARTADHPGPGLLAYLARFVVAALKLYPVFNARLDTERQEIVEYDRIDLGLAVQTERGLVVPAVLGAERLSTARLDAEIRGLTRRAREGRASREELTAGTFTLNNYGGFNVDGSAAIINHPQVAILGFGRIIDRPWVVDGEIRIRKITQMSFVFDHRVCDGGTAAGFMRAVADAVENPASAIERL